MSTDKEKHVVARKLTDFKIEIGKNTLYGSLLSLFSYQYALLLWWLLKINNSLPPIITGVGSGILFVRD